MSNDPSIDAIRAGFRRPAWPILLFVLFVALCAVLLVRGLDFYRLPLEMRPEHEDYRVLAPSGMVGQGYGVFGTALIFANLLYVVRRWLASWPLGSLRAWLDLHVFTGLAGSLLVLFHSAFQLRSDLATITAVSLMFVVLTGIVGRYLVALAPQVDPERMQASLAALDALRPGLGAAVRDGLARTPITRFTTSQTLLSTLVTVPTWMREARGRRRAVAAIVADHPATGDLDESERRLKKRVIRETGKLAAQEVRSEAAVSVLRVWRRMHRFFAILMLLSVGIHIGVAWYYGYRWVFS